MRKQTWFGVVVCLLFLFPGLKVGGYASSLFKYLTAAQDRFNNPELLGLRTLFSTDVFAAVSEIFFWIIFVGIPAAVHGGVAGAIAVLIAAYIYTGPRIMAVATMTGLIATMLMVLVTIAFMWQMGWQIVVLDAWLHVVGMWIGLAPAWHMRKTSSIKLSEGAPEEFPAQAK
jgi:hypothetical protein